MSKTYGNESRMEPDCITIDTTDDDDDEGYVKIRYQQPDIPEIEIPTGANGYLSWKLVRALNPKIIGLAIRSKEKERIMKIENGVIKEPKKGWKAFKVIALLDEPDENVAEEAICSTASSRFVSKIQKESVQTKDFAYSTNLSTVILSNPSPTSSLPELACLAKPVNCVSNKENSTSVQSTVADYTTLADDNVCNPVATSSFPELACLSQPVNDASNNLVPENSFTVQSVADDDVITADNTYMQVFAAYHVKSYEELKMLLSKQRGFTIGKLQMAIAYFKTALIVHADENVFTLLSFAKDSHIFYNQLDPAASDFCDLCQQPLTLRHILEKNHLKKYYSSFHQEVLEIYTILRPENQRFYFNSFAGKLIESPKFSINTCSTQDMFEKIKAAFVHRLSQQNLNVPSNDPLFLDKFMFIRKKFRNHIGILLKLVKFDRLECFPCSRRCRSHQDFIGHIMSVKHIRNGMSQEDLDCFCNLLSFIQKDENGYRLVVPPSSDLIPSSNKRKANDIGMEADTVAEKRPKIE